MKIYVISKNLVVQDSGYTSLKGACKESGVSYTGASRGRMWRMSDSGDLWRVSVVDVVRVSGRGGNRSKGGFSS